MGAAAALPGIVGSVAPGAFGAGVGTGLTAAGGVGLSSLGTGLAAGSAMAGGAGLTGLMGTLGGAVAPGAFGALTPAAASTIAPAVASQLAGTIATPGLAGTLGSSVAPGAFGANLAGATSGLPLVTPNAAGLASTMSNAAATTPAWMNTTLGGSALPGVTSNLPAASLGNAVTGPALPNVTSQLTAGPATTQIIPPTSAVETGANWMQNLGNLISNPSIQGAKDYASEHPYATTAMAGLGAMGVKKLFEQKGVEEPENNAMIRPYTYERTQRPEAYAVSPTQDSSERLYFNDQFVAGEPYKATEKAEGGIASLAVGGPVEQMAAMNSVGSNTGYPMASLQTPMYANPAVQRPEATNVIAPSADAGVGLYSGEPRFAEGGISHLGDYSDGGRLLKGPGDGVSDSIPASIGGRQPARLADGEFVVPARIVSEIGNGSTEAGARKLYAMMDRVQRARRKTVGKEKVAVDSKVEKYLPA